MGTDVCRLRNKGKGAEVRRTSNVTQRHAPLKTDIGVVYHVSSTADKNSYEEESDYSSES